MFRRDLVFQSDLSLLPKGIFDGLMRISDPRIGGMHPKFRLLGVRCPAVSGSYPLWRNPLSQRSEYRDVPACGPCSQALIRPTGQRNARRRGRVHANAGERRDRKTVLGNRPAVPRLSSSAKTTTGRISLAGVTSGPRSKSGRRNHIRVDPSGVPMQRFETLRGSRLANVYFGGE